MSVICQRAGTIQDLSWAGRISGWDEVPRDICKNAGLPFWLFLQILRIDFPKAMPICVFAAKLQRMSGTESECEPPKALRYQQATTLLREQSATRLS